MGHLWFDSEVVAPGAITGLRLHVRPDKQVSEHDLSVSLECAELATVVQVNNAPWLRATPPHEEQRRAPLPSEDVRRQLEGRLEVLEAAHAHYTALEEALQTPKWKLHLRVHPWGFAARARCPAPRPGGEPGWSSPPSVSGSSTGAPGASGSPRAG